MSKRIKIAVQIRLPLFFNMEFILLFIENSIAQIGKAFIDYLTISSLFRA